MSNSLETLISLHSVFGQNSFPLPLQASYNPGIPAIPSNPQASCFPGPWAVRKGSVEMYLPLKEFVVISNLELSRYTEANTNSQAPLSESN